MQRYLPVLEATKRYLYNIICIALGTRSLVYRGYPRKDFYSSPYYLLEKIPVH